MGFVISLEDDDITIQTLLEKIEGKEGVDLAVVTLFYMEGRPRTTRTFCRRGTFDNNHPNVPLACIVGPDPKPVWLALQFRRRLADLGRPTGSRSSLSMT